ncbi:hypothetical protein [Flavivirga sp. 57AJ16]|uniref:hypothetical protein n=1 Tax=Flavivirga sp. 57AJ16 TaxID=3025307 RepID=UPI002366D0A9|nr:hypothetical protein [Flavivirga sp. 57AJ16]MDD7888166.1 hypothetical protein [Flavivirga sp. 57AJ16]MDD7888167.1 hypothetical protein [Flavivirga sp. 57AJ16]
MINDWRMSIEDFRSMSENFKNPKSLIHNLKIIHIEAIKTTAEHLCTYNTEAMMEILKGFK